MRKFISLALLAGLGVAAATASVTAQACPYLEVAVPPPAVYAPLYGHRAYVYPRYARFGYGPGFHRYGYVRGGRWWR